MNGRKVLKLTPGYQEIVPYHLSGSRVGAAAYRKRHESSAVLLLPVLWNHLISGGSIFMELMGTSYPRIYILQELKN